MFSSRLWRRSFNGFVSMLNRAVRTPPPVFRIIGSGLSQAGTRPVFKLTATFSALLISQASAPVYADSTDNTINTGTYLSRNFVADAVAVASPSVVNIRCSMGGFFGTESSGSGFIISEDGFVATNAHVVEHSSTGEVLVTLWNGQKKRGMVHSLDKGTDIALVKLDMETPRLTATGGTLSEDASTLQVARLGKSSQLRAGEFVVALGSPLLLSNSVTFGIVSSTARLGSELGMSQSRTEYIQTDAAINVGNSGGPLVNINGEVIGINTMKIQHSSGISFAIPIDTATMVIEQLKTHKRVVRPYIGMRIANYYAAGAGDNSGRRTRSRQSRNFAPSVVMITDVEVYSPCFDAGLARGDIILEIDGHKVGDVKDVLENIGLEVEQNISLTVQKQDGSIVKTTIKTVPKR
jgi:HtrA serine peptidase 2